MTFATLLTHLWLLLSGPYAYQLMQKQFADLVPVSSPTGIRLVSHGAATNTGGATATLTGLNCTGANFAVLIGTYYSGGTSAFSSSPSNTWTAINPANDDVSEYPVILVYAASPTVSSSMSFTFSLSGGGAIPTIAVACFSGVATASPLDQQSQGNNGGGATTVQPGSITPTANNELVVTGSAVNAYASATSLTCCSTGSYTIADQFTSTGGSRVGGGLAYWIQTTATASNPTWTNSASTTMASTVASFK